MDSTGGTKLKKLHKYAILWVLLALLALGGVTYAWFTFSSHTNVTPIGGAIGSGGVDLFISSDPYDGFGEYADLVTEGTADDLQPVSTADLETWSTSVSNGSGGISNKFRDVTDEIDQHTMYGKLYLRAEGGECEVYFDSERFAVNGDSQLIAASRLGLKLETAKDGGVRYIFSLDPMAGSDPVSAETTMDEENVVIAYTDGSGGADTAPDPSEDLTPYMGYSDGDTTYPGLQPLCTLSDGETVCVDYRIYMEGCDENCINDAMERQLDIKFGFVGVKARDEQ